MIDWKPRVESLATNLTQQGVLARDWRDAFTAVPRHLFVPAFYTGEGEQVSGEVPEERERWLDAVYSDESLITQTRQDAGRLVPTSSSTRPSLMARMLGLLEVSAGHTVLEIGTGTGYNAGLLCRRLGYAQVASIDLDATLVDAARERLASLDCHPHLYVGDGRAGVADQAPYDRIIATAAVPAIPPAWITQLLTDGQLVADVRGNLGSSLIVARKTGEDEVRGRFLAEPGHFMWLRRYVDHPGRLGADHGGAFDFTDPTADTTEITSAEFADPDFRFWLQFAVPDLGPIGNVIRDGQPGIFMIGDTDSSWVEISPAADTGLSDVAYGGPRPLWPQVADAWAHWVHLGRPQRGRFGLIARSDGSQHLWLDHDQQIISSSAVTSGEAEARMG